jgi:hypothetical protein
MTINIQFTNKEYRYISFMGVSVTGDDFSLQTQYTFISFTDCDGNALAVIQEHRCLFSNSTSISAMTITALVVEVHMPGHPICKILYLSISTCEDT